MKTDLHSRLMAEAIEVCKRGIAAGQSPFGAVIATRDGEVVFTSHNRVRQSVDPSAHAEISAIRGACEKLRTIDLSGHVMATTCEPCPMCASAIHWAKLDTVIYGAGIEDARVAGFNELILSVRELDGSGGSGVQFVEGVLRDECRELFQRWADGPNPTPY